MWSVFIVLLTFVCTGVVGNFVVYRWQHHNWLSQRRIQEMEALYNALQKTFDELSELAGRRQHRMVRLLYGLRQDDDEVLKKRRSDHDESVAVWNEKLNGLYAKLTIYFSWSFTTRLEEIQRRFARIDGELVGMATTRSKGNQVSPAHTKRLLDSLNALQGQIGTFNKAVLNEIDRQKKGLYQPVELTPRALNSFPTWELFKALFKQRKARGNVS
jgi:hypothetical protein